MFPLRRGTMASCSGSRGADVFMSEATCESLTKNGNVHSFVIPAGRCFSSSMRVLVGSGEPVDLLCVSARAGGRSLACEPIEGSPGRFRMRSGRASDDENRRIVDPTARTSSLREDSGTPRCAHRTSARPSDRMSDEIFQLDVCTRLSVHTSREFTDLWLAYSVMD